MNLKRTSAKKKSPSNIIAARSATSLAKACEQFLRARLARNNYTKPPRMILTALIRRFCSSASGYGGFFSTVTMSCQIAGERAEIGWPIGCAIMGLRAIGRGEKYVLKAADSIRRFQNCGASIAFCAHLGWQAKASRGTVGCDRHLGNVSPYRKR